MPKLAPLLLLHCLILPLANFRSVTVIYLILVRLPGFAWDFHCRLCIFVFFVSVSLFLPSISPLYLSISPKPNLTLNMPACWPARPLASLPPSLSHPPPSLFPDMKFPVEAHFWLDELFYYININVQVQDLHIRSSNKERAAVILIYIAETLHLLN